MVLGMVFAATIVGCSDNTADEASSETDPTTPTSTSSSSSTAASASTASSSSTSSAPEASTTDAVDQETTVATEPTSTTPPTTGQIVRPGDIGTFTSPSGNIACNMSTAGGVSCWIGEKQWTIDESSEPDCEFDFGNAVDVTDAGVSFPCYSDFGWDRDGPVLAYGDRMVVGEFSCTSAENGVTCANQDEVGFRVARAEVVVF